MEPILNELFIDRVAGFATAQALVEGVLPIPEGKTAASLLDRQGSVTINSIETQKGMLLLSGSVKAEVICLDHEGLIFAFASSADFSHTVAMPQAEAGMDGIATANIQSLDMTLESGRVAMSAIVDIQCRAMDKTPLKVLAGIRGTEDVESKTLPVTHVKRTTAAQQTIRLREEIRVPDIAQVLACNGSAELKSAVPEGERAIVDGNITMYALCADEAGQLSQTVQNIPFAEPVHLLETAMGPGLYGRIKVDSIQAFPIGEGFGILAVEAKLTITLWYSFGMCTALPVDAYSPTYPFKCSTTDVVLLNSGNIESNKLNIKENVSLPEGMPPVHKSIYAAARPVITSSYCVDGRLKVDGLLITRVIYMCDSGLLHSFSEDIPFLMDAAAENSGEDAYVEADATCQYAMVSGSGTIVEVSFALNIETEICNMVEADIVTGAEETEAPEVLGGLSIYFAGAGESMYDVAKRFNVPKAKVMENNPATSEQLSEGDRLLIWVKK